MNTFASFIDEYKIFLLIGLLILCVFVFLSASLRDNVKKMVIALFVVVALGMGYSLVTGKSALDIPQDINAFFNTPSTQVEPSHTYYRDPEKQLKDPL